VAASVAAPVAAYNKDRVLQLYPPTVWEDLDSLLRYRESANLRPSALLTEMMTFLPPQEPPGMLFKALWLSRLPSDVRGHVQLQVDDLDCTQLGAIADKAWLGRNTKQSQLLAAVPDENQQDGLTDAVAALRLGKAKPKSGRPKEQRGKESGHHQRDGQQEKNELCWIHCKYGGDAKICRQPRTCAMAAKVSGNADGQEW